MWDSLLHSLTRPFFPFFYSIHIKIIWRSSKENWRTSADLLLSNERSQQKRFPLWRVTVPLILHLIFVLLCCFFLSLFWINAREQNLPDEEKCVFIFCFSSFCLLVKKISLCVSFKNCCFSKRFLVSWWCCRQKKIFVSSFSFDFPFFFHLSENFNRTGTPNAQQY